MYFLLSMNSMSYSTSDTFFTVNNISILVNKSSFTLLFFKTACHANPVAKNN